MASVLEAEKKKNKEFKKRAGGISSLYVSNHFCHVCSLSSDNAINLLLSFKSKNAMNHELR
jgi:hypothetical protein